MSDAIAKIDASVAKLHGNERERAQKYTSFLAWQLREREKASGLDPSPILKKVETER